MSNFNKWRQKIDSVLSHAWWLGLGAGLVSVAFLLQGQVFYTEPAPTVRVILPARRSTQRPPITPVYYKPLVGLPTATPKATATAKKATATPTPEPTPTPLFVFHKIKRGETLISIAAEYGVTTEALLSANEIRDPTHLEVGQQLMIPPADGLHIPIIPHEIEPGDSLLSIAAKYGSSVKEILAANPGLTDDSLSPGQMVAVPIVFTEANPPPRTAGSSEPVYYTVEAGDIPMLIASAYDIPVEVLLAANNITDPTMLQIGQQLFIPPNDGLTQGVPIILYELEANDTLLGIASKYGSSLKDILAVNPNLDPSNLKPGQTVAIPVIFAPPRPTPAPARATPVPIPIPPALVDLEQQMVNGVNAQRQANGLSPYTVDEQITKMALAHAQDMVVRGYFSHVTPEGLTLRDRFSKAGIGGLVNVGEDIQKNIRPTGETVQFALDWFMGSRPHRQNILHPNHNRIGVGVVEGPPGWYTFVLVFAER